jgi:hypothetical protein
VHRLEVTADQPGATLPDPQVDCGTVDPYPAVTTVLPEESGGLPPNVPPAWPLHVPPLKPPAHIRRHGRRRDWQPAPAGIWPKPAARPASPTQASQ